MEINFDFSTLFSEKIQRLDRNQLVRFNPRRYWAVEKAIDKLGERSTTAQGLKRILTSYQKVIDQEDDQCIYLMWDSAEHKPEVSKLIGLLKIGHKKLYLSSDEQHQFEETPLCILDFYIVESEQRKGNGHALFEHMLSTEESAPDAVAIDRPSKALLQFFVKYYNLTNPKWQSNNFVVYPKFFDNRLPTNVLPQKRGARSEKFPTSSPRPLSPIQSPLILNSARARCDSAAGIIHGGGPDQVRGEIDPNTPLGRKNTRDFGHQKIW